MSNYRILRLKQVEKTRRDKEKKPVEYRRIPVTSINQIKVLRELGWREAFVNQVFNDKPREKLAWFVYPNGMKVINILTSN